MKISVLLWRWAAHSCLSGLQSSDYTDHCTVWKISLASTICKRRTKKKKICFLTRQSKEELQCKKLLYVMSLFCVRCTSESVEWFLPWPYLCVKSSPFCFFCCSAEAGFFFLTVNFCSWVHQLSANNVSRSRVKDCMWVKDFWVFGKLKIKFNFNDRASKNINKSVVFFF